MNKLKQLGINHMSFIYNCVIIAIVFAAGGSSNIEFSTIKKVS
jgi:hypothetical protein